MRLSIILFIIILFTSLNGSIFDRVIRKATKEKKLILLEIYSEYCPHTKHMRIKVLRKGDILKYIHKYYIYYRFNIDRDDKDILPKSLYTERTPTYYFLSSDGKELLEEIIGEMKREDFKYFLIETYKDWLEEQKKRK